MYTLDAIYSTVKKEDAPTISRDLSSGQCELGLNLVNRCGDVTTCEAGDEDRIAAKHYQHTSAPLQLIKLHFAQNSLQIRIYTPTKF